METKLQSYRPIKSKFKKRRNRPITDHHQHSTTSSTIRGRNQPVSSTDDVIMITDDVTTLDYRHQNFLNSQSQTKMKDFLLAVSQLCHSSTQLSHDIWCQLFPTIWSTFTSQEQRVCVPNFLSLVSSFLSSL